MINLAVSRRRCITLQIAGILNRADGTQESSSVRSENGVSDSVEMTTELTARCVVGAVTDRGPAEETITPIDKSV